MRRVRPAAVVALLVVLLVVLGCSTPPKAPPETTAAAETTSVPTCCIGTSPPAVTPAACAPELPKLGPETRDYHDENLALDLDLNLDKGSLTGTATHTLTALADLSAVRMHLVDMSVFSVTADDATCTSSVADGILTIGLDHARKKGERFSLKILYGGKPKSGLWFYKPTPEHPDVPLQVYSQGEGEENRHWIPCYDLPDERMTTSMRVVVPANLQTLGNGRETKTETLADGRVAHTWTMDRPHVSYLITLVAGTFDDVKRDAAGVEQHDLVPPGWGKWCDEVFGRTPDMMGFYQDYTGQPYAWGRYSQVTVWDFMWGGMENTSATTLNMRALHKEGVRPDYSADGLVAHELAHDWFGDLITCRTMNHIWLNEGFATYFTDLWDEHAKGADDFAVDCLNEREGYMNAIDLKATAEKERPKNPTDCGDMQANPYVKGASVLHMLRKLIGDDVFRLGIQRYVRENHDKSVETEALRAAMEAESKTDLKWFFDQWVYGSGYPELTVAVGHDLHEGAKLVVQQTQPVTANMPLFRTSFDVELRWPDRDAVVVRKRFELSQCRQEFDLGYGGPGHGEAAPPTVIFDPDHSLLAKVTEVASRLDWQGRLGGPNVVDRIFAARALADFGPEAVGALSDGMKWEADHSVRAEICTALGKIKNSAEAAAALCAAAEDKDSRVRRAAMTAMGNCNPLFVGDSLKAHLANDASVYVAADAGAALGKTKAHAAYEALIEGLKRDSHRDQIRQRIMDGLKDLADPRGAAIAMGYLDYSWGHGIQHQLRHSAFDAMVALAPDSQETRTWILKLLEDPYFRMKQWAADAAVKLKMTEALPILDDLAVNATGPGVTDAMKAAAEKLRTPPKPAN